MRRQLRPFYTDEQLGEVYAAVYDHTRWKDHVERVRRTVEITEAFGAGKAWFDGIDLSCGDGAILRTLKERGTVQTAYYGDLVSAAHLDVVGRIEETLPNELRMGSSWDLYVCSETLEHVSDPDELLRGARVLARNAVFSTPIDETVERHNNPEHYWGWSTDDLDEMLAAAGWTERQLTKILGPYYDFQVWCCS